MANVNVSKYRTREKERNAKTKTEEESEEKIPSNTRKQTFSTPHAHIMQNDAQSITRWQMTL